MKYIGLAIAVVVAMIAGFLVLQASQKKAPVTPTERVVVVNSSEPAISEVLVYAAARDIPIGTKIDANMLTTLKWPEHLVVSGFIRAGGGAQDVVGMVARASFRRDEPMNSSKLINPNDPSFLAGELPEGMRVVTIQTDEIEGVAGFVFPGDRVDVMVTHRVLREGVTTEDLEDGSTQSLMEDATETLLYDVRVLAVDQRATGGEGQDDGIIIPRSMSLEVTPGQAQKLKLGAEIGKLSLSLRALEGGGKSEMVTITRQSGISQAVPVASDGDEKGVSKKSGVRIIRGTEIEQTSEEE